MKQKSALEVYGLIKEGEMTRSDFLDWLYKRCELESEAHAELHIQNTKLVIVSEYSFNGHRPIAGYFDQDRADVAIAKLFAYHRAAYPAHHFDDEHFVSTPVDIEPIDIWNKHDNSHRCKDKYS